MAASETQPLLAHVAVATGAETSNSSSPSLSPTILDAADFENDPDNPHNWPPAFKWSIVLLLAAMAFTVTFTCISIVPLSAHIVDELDGGTNTRAKTSSVLVVTIWELGEAAGPLAIAPLSETAAWGRYAVLNVTTLLFIAATAAAALAPSTAFFIGARGFTGVAVATNVLSPAIIGDVFAPAERGSAMAIVQLAPLLGGAVGPAVGGLIASKWGWRTVLHVSMVLASTCSALFLFAFRETYPPAIRRRRRQRLAAAAGLARKQGSASGSNSGTNSGTESPSGCLVSTLDGPSVLDTTTATVKTPSNASSLRNMRDAVLRPAIVIGNSLVLALLALFGAVVFSYFYTLSVSLPTILEQRYGLSPAATGASFLSFSAGSTISIVLCNRLLDRIYLYLARTRGTDGEGRPEFRLPLAAVSGCILPLCVSLYGWCAELHAPLWLMLGSVVLQGASLSLTFIPLASYVVDAFGLYAASAMTGLIVTRCLCGTFLPMMVVPLVDALGYGWGFTVMSAACLVLVPVPVLVFHYGERWRQWSKYTRTA